jgi:hypothetical protein
VTAVWMRIRTEVRLGWVAWLFLAILLLANLIAAMLRADRRPHEAPVVLRSE